MTRPRAVELRFALLAPFVVGSAAAAGCVGDGEVPSQWTITIGTDAPLPLVGDRLLVEVLTPGGDLACDGCRRLLDGHAEAFPVSFGVAASNASKPSLRLRVRLHRGRAVLAAGTPDPGTTIDTRVALPDAPGPVRVDLPMQCFGAPSTVESTCDPATGALGPLPEAASGSSHLEVGSWSYARPGTCVDAQAPDGMLCGPAGLFFFGSLRDPDEPFEHLAYLSPFYLDVDELSVGRARALIAAGTVTEEPRLRGDSGTLNGLCTYLGRTDASNDAMPLNCVDRTTAAKLCDAQGKVLTTEAQLAAAAGNGAVGSRFSWGEETDVCARAVVARSTSTIPGAAIYFECRLGSGMPFGPVRVGPSRDATFSPAGFRNLAGNLAEWASDGFLALDAPFWQARPVLVDPRAPGTIGVVRGGSWEGPIAFAQSFSRSRIDGNGRGPDVGFRCAKPAN